LIILAVTVATSSGDLFAEVSAIKEAAAEECTSDGKSNNNTATCTYQKHQHSDSTTLSNSAKGNPEISLNHGSSTSLDHNNNNNKHDSQKDTPFILPFP
jgi:hypothetical protein